MRAADQLHALRAYLSKRPTSRESAHESAHADLGLVVVIPCHDEPDPLTTLESLWRCLRPRCAVEILLVVNASESDDERLRARNRATVDAVHAWSARFDEPRFRFRVLNYPALPARHAGVGLARKIGMDEALGRFVTVGNDRGIIASLDADCTCDHDYLVALESHFDAHPHARACSIYFEHDLDGPLSAELCSAITRYELFLRYYRHGLRYAAFPHDRYTVGSCLAVRCDAYARHGGMNRRKAGEDFYFLNKLMAVGGVTENNATRVVPGVRASTRTPFGTGRALHHRLTNPQRSWLTYDPRVFRELAELVAAIDSYYRMPPGAWRGQPSLSPCMEKFLIEHDITGKHAEIHANSASPASFRKRFFQWFDAFRALKFIHYASDHAYPRQPLEQACATLLQWRGVPAPSGSCPSATDMLHLLRNQDRGRAVFLDSQQVPVRLSTG